MNLISTKPFRREVGHVGGTRGRFSSDEISAVSIFSKRLSSARRALGLSQCELAEKTGLQQVAISLFETGRRAPSFENLKRLADGLEVTSDYLMGRSNFPDVFARAKSRLFRTADKLSAKDLEVLRQVAEDLARQKS